MVIFKAQNVGGPVHWHQDACFLATDSKPVIGLWVALEDATIENGCLWVVPRGHVQGLKRRYVRDDRDRLSFVELDGTPLDTTGAIPVEVPLGSVIALHGFLPHCSYANRSPKSRCAMTFHIIDGTAQFAPDNWMRTPLASTLGDRHDEI